MKKILIFGGNGMVGKEIAKNYFLNQTKIVPGSKDCNFMTLDQPKNLILESQPDIIINLAAFTDVDRSESQKEEAMMINGTALKHIAEASAKVKAYLIHISTDYVFSGNRRPPLVSYSESEIPDPIQFYGLSKLTGETQIIECQKANPDLKACILRTSWIMGRFKNSFPEAILKKAWNDTSDLQVVDDQIGTPTLASDLASAIEEISLEPFNGILHYASRNYCSRYDLAKEILAAAQLHVKSPKFSSSRVKPIPTSLMPRPAKRPFFTGLDTSKFSRAYRQPLAWQEAVRIHVQHLKENGFLDQLCH